MGSVERPVSFPRCRETCEAPDGVALKYNCPGPLRIIDATDVTALPGEDDHIVTELLGTPVDMKVCRNPAVEGVGAEAVRRGLRQLDDYRRNNSL